MTAYIKDESVLRELYDLYGGALYNYVYQIINDKGAAEEIVENTFIKLWTDKNTFYRIQHIRTYLFASTRNACLSYQNTLFQ
jgi:RNA polymerase sigma-70 factor (ECF subfamily)